MNHVYNSLRHWQQRRVELEVRKRMKADEACCEDVKMLKVANDRGWLLEVEKLVNRLTQKEAAYREAVCADEDFILELRTRRKEYARSRRVAG